MRYFRIFLLHFQDVFEQRSKSFVWFLWGLLNTFILILYWRGAVPLTNYGSLALNIASLTTYYLLQIIIGAVCMSHIENDVGYRDIQSGQLSTYLLRPFSYYKEKLLTEIPYRILQGGMGCIMVGIIFLFSKNILTIHQSFISFLLTMIIIVLAFFLSFTIKMIVGLTAFWVTDIGGLFQLSEMLIFVFAGYILPLYLFPKPWDMIAYFLPYGYIIYFPTLALQGTINTAMLLHIIFIQLIWLSSIYLIYRHLWKYGIRKFTALGQ